MTTNVVMPQMGESIAEGTIVRWLKQVGDTVERDEPLFEISTDKVDAEIPSPAAGVLVEIRAKEGETVPVNAVVALIGAEGAAGVGSADSSTAAVEEVARIGVPAVAPDTNARGATPAAQASDGEVARVRSSPLVRSIAREHQVDLTHVRGTGIGGRVTKNDILGFIARRAETPTPGAVTSPVVGRPSTASGAAGAGLAGQVVPMSVMRRKIAEHMIESRRTSAHVHTVFDVNFGEVHRVRQEKKAEYERVGVKLTYLSFIVKAAADALRAVPVVNASIDGQNVVYHDSVDIGVAVALDWGLIVPVIRKADEKNLLGISRTIADLAERAREKQLKPEDVTGGTFTITNPGGGGSIFGLPIINQPQVGILCVGAIEKRPVVVDDAIAIRPMAYLSLGFDHRIIDGAVADQFMAHLKRSLEHWGSVDE